MVYQVSNFQPILADSFTLPTSGQKQLSLLFLPLSPRFTRQNSLAQNQGGVCHILKVNSVVLHEETGEEEY